MKNNLEAIGIYLVPVGNGENFCRSLGSRGPKFVNKLLTQVPFDDHKLDGLRTFVEMAHRGSHAPLEKMARAEDGDLETATEPATQSVEA